MGGLPANRTVNGFVVAFDNPKTMFVAMRDGLFKSIDAGISWRRVANEVKNFAAVAVNPKKSSEVYAATAEGAIYLSTDAGGTWKKR